MSSARSVASWQSTSGGLVLAAPSANGAASRRSRLARALSALRSGPATVAVLVALGASGVNLYFVFRPDHRPDAPIKVRADLAILAVERNVKLGQYLRLRLRDPKELADARKEGATDLPMDVVYVQAEIEGLRKRKTLLRWWLYDGDGKRIGDDVDEQRGAPHKQETLSDRFVFPIAVSVPDEAPGYFLRVELWVGDVLLAMVDSPPLRPARRPASA